VVSCFVLLVAFASAAEGDCETGCLDCSRHCVHHEFGDSSNCVGITLCAHLGTSREHLRCFCPRECGSGRRRALESDGPLAFDQRRERVEMEKKRHEQAQEILEDILSHDISVEDRREELSAVFALLDTDENGLLSNRERQFLFKDIVNNAVEMIFGDAQTLTMEEWCEVEFDVVPHKLAPSSTAEQQMICQWEEDVIVDDCGFDFQLLTEGDVLTRGQMTDYYYTVLNPAQDWTPAQLEGFLFNSKRDPLQKIFASQAMKVSNVNTVTSTVNDCAGVPTSRRSLQASCVVGPLPCIIETTALWGPAILVMASPWVWLLGRRSLMESSLPLLTSVVSNLASTDDCDFTNCPELHGLLGMLQHNTFCEEGVEENCVWTQNLFMPSN